MQFGTIMRGFGSPAKPMRSTSPPLSNTSTICRPGAPVCGAIAPNLRLEGPTCSRVFQVSISVEIWCRGLISIPVNDANTMT